MAVRIECWSNTLSYETQDMWWLAGITRSVIVYARPPVHIRDFEVRSRASQDGTANFFVTAELRQLGGESERSWLILVALNPKLQSLQSSRS
jgi:beta-galactosidase